MKALTLTQPWARLVAAKAKQWETRSWKTNYRGPIAIHAALGFPVGCQQLGWKRPFSDYLTNNINHLLEDRGKIVAVGILQSILTTEDWYEAFRSTQDDEFHFGDYSDHRFAWHITEVVALPQPIPCKGAQGLWNVPEPIVSVINSQLSIVH